MTLRFVALAAGWFALAAAFFGLGMILATIAWKTCAIVLNLSDKPEDYKK